MFEYPTLDPKSEQVVIAIGFLFLFYFHVANNLLLFILGISILFIHGQCSKITKQLNALEEKITYQKENEKFR